MPQKQINFLSDEEWPSSCFDFELPIDPATTGLFAIDLQNYCVDPMGHLAQGLRRHDPKLFESYERRVKKVVRQVKKLLSAFRSQGRKIVYTRHGSLLPDGCDLVERRRSREQKARGLAEGDSGHLAVLGSRGHEILSELRPQPGDLVLDKNTSSAFNSTGINLFLRNMNVETAVVCGLVSDQCVLSTALDAADRGFHVIIASDACTTIDPGSHESTLLLFRRVWGYVMETEAILQWLAGRTVAKTSC